MNQIRKNPLCVRVGKLKNQLLSSTLITWLPPHNEASHLCLSYLQCKGHPMAIVTEQYVLQYRRTVYFTMYTYMFQAVNHTQLQLAVYAQRLQWLEKEEGYIWKKKNLKTNNPQHPGKKSPRKIVPKRHLTKKTNPNNYQTHCISNRLWRCLKISSKFMSYFQEWVCLISLGWFNCKTERASTVSIFPIHSFFFILSRGR